MEKIKIGIVGLGWVSQVFHIPQLLKIEDVEIVGVCDKNKERARFIAERFNIKKYYNDYDQLLKSDTDVIFVCTSTDAHCAITKAALEAGKDVFVEKPIARLHSEAEEMAECARVNKRKLMVGMNNRFRPDSMILKSFIDKGELGKVFYCKSGWFKNVTSNNTWLTKKDLSGGGVILDLGIVIIDLALWMLDFPSVARVTTKTFQHTTKSVEDSAIILIELKGGTTLFVETSWSFKSEEDFFYCNFYGTEGSAMINPLRVHKQLHGNLVNVTPAKVESSQNLHKKSYENELRHFIGAVRGLHPIISTGDEAAKRMKVVEAIYHAAKKGKEVTI
ncbi:MAG: Gfo/Idh/MocA family protein [Bacteroidota bacterium]